MTGCGPNTEYHRQLIVAVCTVPSVCVAVHRSGGEGGGAGQVGELRQPGSFLPGPAAASGTRRRRLVQGGVLTQSGGPADLSGQLLELFAGVGSVGDDVDAAAG